MHGSVADVETQVGARRVLDVGCGIGRFGTAVKGRVAWVGVDRSPRQLLDCPRRPVGRADALALPLTDNSIDAVTLLWMLYHVNDLTAALREAQRVVRSGGIVVACTASRRKDPDLVPGGHPPTTFDAEEAPDTVRAVFGHRNIDVDRWDQPMVDLGDRGEVLAYARSHLIEASLAERVSVPLALTKRGCLIWARND